MARLGTYMYTAPKLGLNSDDIRSITGYLYSSVRDRSLFIEDWERHYFRVESLIFKGDNVFFYVLSLCKIPPLNELPTDFEEYRLAHFRVLSRVLVCLCVKTSLRSKLFLWKCASPASLFYSFSYKKFCTKTRFETEANQNSEMGYYKHLI